jgi:adhesin transport system outer membrane protein
MKAHRLPRADFYRATALAAMLCVLGIGSASAESLREAIEKTLRTSPDVQIEAARRLAAEAALDQARGGYLPRVDLMLGKGKQQANNPTTRASYGDVAVDQNRYDRTLTLSQMLFDGFGTSSEVERNRARTESASHKLAFASDQAALKAIEAYLEVLRQEEVIRLTKENLDVHLRTQDQISLRASSGVGRKSDLDQINARVALSRANLTAAEANLVIAKVNYKLVVGDMPGELSLPKPPDIGLLPKSADEAVLVALGSNRVLQSAKADWESAQAQHRAAKAPYYPRFDLELGKQNNELVSPADRSRDENAYIMLRMRYNLFRGGADMARAAETRNLAWEAQEVMLRAERQLEQSTRLSWNAFRSAVDRLPDLRKHADSSRLTREAYSKQFSLGQRTLLDLLDTENEYYTANVNFVNGQYVEIFSRYRVLADTGMLLDALTIPHREEVLPAY